MGEFLPKHKALFIGRGNCLVACKCAHISQNIVWSLVTCRVCLKTLTLFSLHHGSHVAHISCPKIHVLNIHILTNWNWIVRIFFLPCVVTPLWGKCEVATHILENGTWESFGTPKNSQFDCRGQNTLHWGVLYTVGKVSEGKCPKWPCMTHLDICNTIYRRKKG